MLVHLFGGRRNTSKLGRKMAYRLATVRSSVDDKLGRKCLALKEIGTIKRFYSVYGVYYVLLHFIQSSVITKCGFIPEKRS